ncbi:hypothetical protein B0H63DRAFT_28487 [Podospora didyma]|uniref:Sm domain-containing protein n=1 Tax=Podospora didyma TaxID=330526 RepID=A0AAE0P5T6_9PEZI|nr:hypothetical protein B0H63DRAFT_28487 [Podospora didyma]
MSDENITPLTTEAEQSEEKNLAALFLQSLLNKNLRVTTTDQRMFWGSFKCTDPDSNIVLQDTYEYRQPTFQTLRKQTSSSSSSSFLEDVSGGGTVKLDMTSRYLGLVVVPGEHIVKMEVEEFASQMKK